jgi:hypothetical protein
VGRCECRQEAGSVRPVSSTIIDPHPDEGRLTQPDEIQDQPFTTTPFRVHRMIEPMKEDGQEVGSYDRQGECEEGG